MAAEKQGAPTTTKKRTTGPPILPPINDNVSHLCASVPGAFTLLIPPLKWDAVDFTAAAAEPASLHSIMAMMASYAGKRAVAARHTWCCNKVRHRG